MDKYDVISSACESHVKHTEGDYIYHILPYEDGYISYLLTFDLLRNEVDFARISIRPIHCDKEKSINILTKSKEKIPAELKKQFIEAIKKMKKSIVDNPPPDPPMSKKPTYGARAFNRYVAKFNGEVLIDFQHIDIVEYFADDGDGSFHKGIESLYSQLKLKIWN